MRRFLALFAALLFVPAIALAAVSVGGIGTTGSTGGSSQPNTTITGVNAVAGQPIVVVVVGSSALGVGVSSISDNVNLTTGWVCGAVFVAPNAQEQVWCWNLNPLAMSSATITFTPVTGNFMRAAAAQITGATVTAVDVQSAPTPVSGTGTGGTVATGALGQTSEVVIGAYDIGGAGGATVSDGTGITALPQVTSVGGGDEIRWGWKAVASASSSNYDPASTNSHPYSLNIITFKISGGGPPPAVVGPGMLMGVGR